MMNFVYVIVVIALFSLIYVVGYFFNNKFKIECNKDEYCDGCNVKSCYHKKEGE